MVQKVVVYSLPAGKRRVTKGGRVFYSNYYLPTKDQGYQPASKSALRYTAKVYVLGDRRPYTIEVEVARERRDAGSGDFTTYTRDGFDERLAKILSAQIKGNLSKRPEDLNIIDDFRVF